MRKWILENTNITEPEYDNKVGARKILQEINDYPEYFTLEDKALIEKKAEELTTISSNTIYTSSVIKGEAKREETINAIERFTLLLTDDVQYNNLLRERLGIKQKEGFFKYEINGFHFTVLSSSMNNKNAKNILTSKERLGKCHEMSEGLVRKNPDTELIIGKIEHINRYLYLHSIAKRKSIVIDYTKNLIMPTKEYYKLYRMTIYNAIPREKLLEQKSKINELIKLFPDIKIMNYEFYLWPEEIIEALERIKQERLSK